MPLIYEETPEKPVNAFHKLNGPNFQKATEILDVIHRYSLPFTPTQDRSDEGSLKFLTIIYSQVKAAKPIQLILPAFPFKSPNSTDKVLGRLPDKGEAYALCHLNGLCAGIADIYENGAKLTIASDGLVYNDLLGVPDGDVWNYGQTLRDMAAEMKLPHIDFIRLRDLLGLDAQDPLDQVTYKEKAPYFRSTLVNTYTPKDHDADLSIANDEDICMTYRGYIKFLMKDLAHSAVHEEGISKSQYKKRLEKIAKKMITRGVAFAQAIERGFPNYIRLSIHPSCGSKKISLSVLPCPSLAMTPWHSSICFKLDGQAINDHRDEFEASPDLELISKNGQPWYFREKSDLYSWNFEIDIEPIYPCGLIIRPAAGPRSVSIKDVDMIKVKKLSEHNSPIVLRGFSDTVDRDLFIKKSHEMGKPLAWLFGLVLEVKDRGQDTRGLNNVLCEEWMPYHYDGIFKTEKQTDPETGEEKLVSIPPRYQLFTGVTPSPPNTGYTLFASSALLFKHLPRPYTLEQLSALTWTVRTGGFNEMTLEHLPLVSDHFSTSQPCIRYHEPWPQERTRFLATKIEIEGMSPKDSKALCDVLDSLLHDRRVCYWHAWDQGDYVVNDNVSMMHTRSDFTGGADRELWRIHVD
ncbi:MAG: hypothetical protein M1834_000607 [Cirrosporium novae-zelandiae]|nr:MAG: hypothetical protein M1834_000607 [Cirrosporium novae-zelandiae]